jgi:hypothetical protein
MGVYVGAKLSPRPLESKLVMKGLTADFGYFITVLAMKSYGLSTKGGWGGIGASEIP